MGTKFSWRKRTDLAVPLVNVGSSPVADDDLGAVKELQVVQQEGHGEEGQRGSQDSWACSLLDAEQGYHDDLEEHHGGDDVLEDLHPQLHHKHTGLISPNLNKALQWFAADSWL